LRAHANSLAPSLLLNRHVDVVPADAGQWSAGPCQPRISGGWLTGRGAGDMKGGFAMGLLAIAALRRARPEALTGELGFASVIEEECTGNGTLAASAGVPWLGAHPPLVREAGFRAEGFLLDSDHPLANALALAHAADEAVELASIERGARTLARFMTAYYAGDGLPRGSA
jgi:acetylornithine deacetylase/succinyl-diaminopimelate desuccinylase-like protein